MNRDQDIQTLTVFAIIGMIVTFPLWGPIVGIVWLWDKVRNNA